MRFLFLLGLGLTAWPTADAQSATLGYSTYLGSYLNPQAMALDGSGNVYIAGSVTLDPYARTGSLFVAKLNPAGTGYEYLTYFGTAYDGAAGIAVDGAGNAYVTGSASSPSFPVTGTEYFGYGPTGSNLLALW